MRVPSVRDARGRWIVMAILLLSHVLAAVAVWGGSVVQLGMEDAPGGDGAMGRADAGVEDDAPAGPRQPLEGQVWLEVVEFEDGENSDEGGREGPDERVEDDGADATSGGVEALTELEAPAADACRIVAWQAGRRVGHAEGCDASGGYRLMLEPGVQGTVAVEVSVPRRLRGLVELEVPAPPAGAGPDERLEPLEVTPMALGLGYLVAGAVQDARGDPVGGVIVEARPNPDLDEPEPWRAQTDAAGNFAFDTLPEGQVALRVDHRDYDVSVVETVAPVDDVLIVVSELIDLRGRVIAQGEDLDAATVRIEGSSLWPPVEYPVAEDGSFVLERLPDGIYGVEVILEHAAGGGSRASYPTENVTPDLTLDLGLVDAAWVPVEVIDTEGHPVAGARVRVGYAAIGMLQKLATADDAGQVRVGPVVPGPYLVSADASGYLPAEPVEIEVGADGELAPVQLVLARPGRIEGKVIDEAGLPVVNAEVTIESDELFVAGEAQARARLFTAHQSAGLAGAERPGGPRTGSLGVTRGKVPDIPLPGEADEALGLGVGVVLSEEGGRFVVEGLVPGRYVLRARHGQHAGSPPQTVDLGSGELEAGVVLRLREGALLTGRVVDGNGQPIANVRVSFEDGLMLLTDAQGSFDAGHHRGTVPLVLRADGYAPKRVTARLSRSRPLELDVRLDAADGQIEGRLVDGNGRPVADASVLLRPRDGLSPAVMTESDAHGVFSAAGLPRGEVEIEVEHPELVSTTVRRPARAELGVLEEFELVEGWRLELEVVEGATGEPIRRASVQLPGTGGRTDADGRLSVDRLQPGATEVRIVADGFVPHTLKIQAAAAAAGVALTRRVQLQTGGGMSGTVTDDVGDEVAGAQVRIRTPSGGLLAETRTGKDGSWSVTGLPEGDVLVEAEPPAALAEIVGPAQMASDVLRGRVTSEVDLRFDRL